MTIPGKRVSRSKTRRRRSHLALTKIHLIKCSKCGKPTQPHRVCRFCGTYQGREIIKPKIKKKKEKK
jgi:large subunit ribosomal protein L32